MEAAKRSVRVEDRMGQPSRGGAIADHGDRIDAAVECVGEL
jgi:hypothetical protein